MSGTSICWVSLITRLVNSGPRGSELSSYDVAAVLSGYHPIYFTVSDGREPLFDYIHEVGIYMRSDNVRLPVIDSKGSTVGDSLELEKLNISQP